MIDGGAFDWLAKFTSNRRAVYISSGTGAQLIAFRFRVAWSRRGAPRRRGPALRTYIRVPALIHRAMAPVPDAGGGDGARHLDAITHTEVPLGGSPIVEAAHEVPEMKLRYWFGIRACTGLTALLVTASSTASAQSTLQMRRAPIRLAQAQQPTPPPTPPAAPTPDAAPPAPPPPAPEATSPAPDQPAPGTPSDTPAPEEVPITEDTFPPDEGEVIVVTGSRIGDPLGKQAPVLMLSREDLDRTGLTSIGDILQQLPVSGGAINGKFNSSGNFGFPPDGGGIGAGAVEADLRYLGSKRVLVLVDGVRWVNGSSGSGVAAATDLNTIPLAIVERIEVLEDGASPLYGSDAIAGVINIITRKELTGAIASAYTGGFHQGDGFVQKYDVSWGSTTPKMSMVFSASLLDQRTVFSSDRELSDSPIPGLDNCEAGCSSATPQGRVVFHDPITNTDQDLTLNNGIATPGYPGDYHDFQAMDRFNFSPFNLVQTPSRRMGAFSSVTYKLSPLVNVRGKASFTNRQSVNQAAPEPLFIGPQAGNGNRMDRIKVDVTNPYNPFGFTFDPALDPTYVITRRPLEAGPRKFEQTVNTFYTTGGLDGRVNVGSRRFNWDATVAYGVNRAEQRRNNSFNSQKLEEALGPAFLGADGNFHCGTAANPGDPDCVPFNIFGGQGADGRGSITPEMLAYTTFTEHDVSEQTLVATVANIAGNLVKLPAGWLAAAAGVEHRRLNGFYEPDSVVAAGDGADVPSQPTSGDYSVSEAYAELRAPLVIGSPGAELLDVNAAARVSKYSFLSSEFTGKVGARWKPTKDLIVRGSLGTGFRAPSIGELFGSKSRFDATLADPCSDFNRAGVSDETRQSCIALGVPADGSYAQLNPQISVTTGGNEALQPETSTSINVSLAYSPAALQDRPWSDIVDIELAYYDIRLDGAVSALDAQLQLDRCVAGDNTFCNGILRNPQGTIFSFSNVLQNLGGINVRGLDLTLTYKMPRKDFGRFRATSQSSYLLAYEEEIPSASGFDTVDRTGTVAGTPERAFPRFKSALSLGWLYKQFEVTLTTRYINPMTEQCRDLAGFDDTCSDPDPDDDTQSTNHLGATVYNDVQAVWSPEFDRALTVTAGVTNLFNRDPPTCYSCALNGFNGATYDVPGIFGYLTATYHVQ
jgi:iron complex outermembrane receptor protein